MQKPELYYCPDGLLVQLSAFQAKCPGLNPTCTNFCFFWTIFPLQTDTKKHNFVYMFLNLIECF